jgi:hypothetical protein
MRSAKKTGGGANCGVARCYLLSERNFGEVR